MLLANVRLDWKVIARYKHSSLLGLVVSDEGIKFYNIDTWILEISSRHPSEGSEVTIEQLESEK